MLDFIRHIAGFSAFAIFSITLFMGIANQSQLFEKYTFYNESSYGDTYRRMADFEGSAPHDLWLLGSSTCYRGIDPNYLDKTGKSGFNLCSGMQTIKGSKATLQWALKKHPKPSHIILDIYPDFWHSKPYEYFLDVATNHKGDRDIDFDKFIIQSRSIFIPIVSIYHNIKNRTKHARLDTKNRGNGFTYSEAKPFTAPNCKTREVSLSSELEISMQEFRDICSVHNIQLILLNPPQLCEETFERPQVMRNLPWIEGNDWPLSKEDSLYYDDHHLRGVGAELYSNWIADQLNEIFQ